MRDVIKKTTETLSLPSAENLADAKTHWGNKNANERYQTDWPCLNAVELLQPETAVAPPDTLTVVAWNIERCKWVEPSSKLIKRTGADVVLASEVDLGMARSRQRHTTRDLAASLCFGYAFGVEFVELDLGDANETIQCKGMTNLHGLHGNAILSRYPLYDVSLIPLDAGEYWFLKDWKTPRVGGRMAIAARIDTASGPLVLCSVHYESESDAKGRTSQTETLLHRLDALYGSVPVIIGGDLNTKDFHEAGTSGPQMLARPELIEPSFSYFARNGFDWRTANTGEVTTRVNPTAPANSPLKTLDWLLTRSVTVQESFVVPALSESGDYLSDHELIGARIHTYEGKISSN